MQNGNIRNPSEGMPIALESAEKAYPEEGVPYWIASSIPGIGLSLKKDTGDRNGTIAHFTVRTTEVL
ncbi:MAG TPA: hypothetical protein DEA96_15650 [Leptospiraceae bacterium]|nr:hypothetical protein [Leptospiraceae bacterium]